MELTPFLLTKLLPDYIARLRLITPNVYVRGYVMLRLRPYKPIDAAKVVAWIKDEDTFKKWSADRFDHYPITADELNAHYDTFKDSDSFYVFTAFDENDVVGQMLMRFLDESKEVLRFGFVIVDSDIRGKGYGKQMIKLALKYAFEILGAKKITIGVFDNNPPARKCYETVGFSEEDPEEVEPVDINGQVWNYHILKYTYEDYVKC